MELMGSLIIVYEILTHVCWSKVAMFFLNEYKMHKQSIKEVEVRKIVFKDIIPYVKVKQKSSKPSHRFIDHVMLTYVGEALPNHEAISMHDHTKWKQAMQNELDCIHTNGTWGLMPLPKGGKALPCKWVYKYKYTFDGVIPKYKSRIVAKGFKQEQGVDFDEIYYSIVKMAMLYLH